MHVVFRESHGLEETETPFDVGQDPADLVVLSFSDSDLGAFTAWVISPTLPCVSPTSSR
jgi:cobaltochelatase CobN